MPPSLWIDVEDLFLFAAHSKRPTGIQRVAFEISHCLQAEFGGAGRVRFVRHDLKSGGLIEIPWSEVQRLIDRLTRPSHSLLPQRSSEDGRAGKPTPPPAHQTSRARRWGEKALAPLPQPYRGRLFSCLQMQWWVLGRLSSLALLVMRDVLHRLRRNAKTVEAAPVTENPSTEEEATLSTAHVRPGDVLVMLGAPGSNPNFAALARRCREVFGMRVALLYHDIIPIRRPEWFDATSARAFKAWHTSMLPELDHVFAISRATADDVARYARSCGHPLTRAASVIPLGTGFSLHQPENLGSARSASLPSPGSYVLYVSTLEVRKNHILLFRVWRRLLEEMPPDQTPTLVFAGAKGWIVADLITQMQNSDYLNGKLLHLDGLADDDIAQLYRGCLFTLYPSLMEGWGLPVTESHMFGRPCITSDRSSMPEAGGTLARYLDPENVEDAYRVIRATLDDREGLEAWAARVRAEFQPVSWGEAARHLARELGAAR